MSDVERIVNQNAAEAAKTRKAADEIAALRRKSVRRSLHAEAACNGSAGAAAALSLVNAMVGSIGLSAIGFVMALAAVAVGLWIENRAMEDAA